MRMNRTDHKIPYILNLRNIVDISCIICDSMHLIRVHRNILLKSSTTDSSIIREIDSFCFTEVLDKFIDVGSFFFIFLLMIPFFIWLILLPLKICLFHQLLFLGLLVFSVHPSEDLL